MPPKGRKPKASDGEFLSLFQVLSQFRSTCPVLLHVFLVYPPTRAACLPGPLETKSLTSFSLSLPHTASKATPQTTTTASNTNLATTTTTAPPTSLTATAPASTDGPTPQPPQTIRARSEARRALSRPYETLLHQQRGSRLAALAPHEQSAWLAARVASRLARRPALSSSSSSSSAPTGSGGGGSQAVVARLACGGGNKTVKEVWKVVNEASVPLRSTAKSIRKEGGGGGGGGADLPVKEFEKRWERQVWLSCLAVESRWFQVRRERERRGEREDKSGDETVVVTEQEVFEETRRRKEMAALTRELYGGGVGRDGKLGLDPEWDDVQPVVLEEPEGALAAIAYPADYGEGELMFSGGLGDLAA